MQLVYLTIDYPRGWPQVKNLKKSIDNSNQIKIVVWMVMNCDFAWYWCKAVGMHAELCVEGAWLRQASSIMVMSINGLKILHRIGQISTLYSHQS